jgi:hypothetical protein
MDEKAKRGNKGFGLSDKKRERKELKGKIKVLYLVHWLSR